MRDRGKTLEMYGGEELGSHCRKHPSQASGGICALCLKDRLSKLICSDCGEQRPPSCSCSEAASSSSNNANNNKDTIKAGTVDVGSAGRISFLIESDNVVDLKTGGNHNDEGVLVGAEQFQCDVKSKPTKPDAIVLMKRSKSVACTTISTKTTPTATPPSSMTPPPLLPLPTGTVGESKVCASDNTIKRPSSSFWSFLYFVKSRQTPPKSNNTNSAANITSQHSKHNGVGSSHKSSKQEVVHRLQEMHSNRPTKQGLGSRKAREHGLLDFVDEISPRPTKVGLVNGKPTEHRVEDSHTTHSWNVHESPLWILPKLFRSRSVGCGRNSFSVDHDDASPRRLESVPKGHMRSFAEEKKSSLTKGKYKQSSHRSPKSPAAASAGYMKIDKDDEQSKARVQSSGKTKGLFGAFGKSGATLNNMSSVESADVNQTSGASTGKGRGWSWAFSSPARIFRHSYHRKPGKEATNSSSNGFLNHVKSNAAASNSAGAALYGD